MAKAVPYKDLNKSGDLLTRNFLGLNSISITSETKSGDVTIKGSVSGDDKKPFASVLEPKYEWKEHDIVFEGKFSTANAFNAKGTFRNAGTEGLNLSVAGDRVVKKDDKKDKKEVVAPAMSNSATGGLQFTHELVNLSVDVKIPIAAPQEKISVASTLHARPHPNASVGLKVDYVHGGDLTGEGKLVGGTSQIEGGLSVTYPEKVVGGSVWHSYSSLFQWAASVSHPLGPEKKATVANVAGNYKFDDFTTLKGKLTGNFDAKAENSFRGAASLQQKINLNTTITVGADININHAFGLGKAGDASSYGFQLGFK